MLSDSSIQRLQGAWMTGRICKISMIVTDFKRAKLMFWPIVVGVTLFFGYFDGIKGAFVGFLYGVAGGLFLLHERSRCNKK